ncbi:MAG: DUF1329 domain-containing protein [Candidatus Binatia bacterium]|nr:DUF1329 domain-containing protein [Candidatus Binatia bacterium]
MRSCRLHRLALGVLLAAVVPARADVRPADALHASFHPLGGSLHAAADVPPGTSIDAHNYARAAHLLPAEILQLVQAGDFPLRVQETTDLPPRASYIAATLERSFQVSLDSGYTIHQYTGGRPFPVLDPGDPAAGEKAAWNFRYRDMPDTLEMRATMDGVTNTGVVDRASVGRIRVRNGMDRVGNEENDRQWASQGIRTKASFEALAPADIEGMMRITTYYDNQQHQTVDIVYTPQSRRTRKSYVNMLARMGGGRFDILQEEQPPFFFSGYLSDYHWIYKGEQTALVPGFLRAAQVTFGGKNNWYPQVPWEVRRVVVIEAVPKRDHPYPRRLFYLDAQTYTPLYLLSYDARGAFVRLSLIVHGHPDFVPGTNGIRLPVPLGATWINFAQQHAYRMIADRPIFGGALSPRRFELMELLRKGK